MISVRRSDTGGITSSSSSRNNSCSSQQKNNTCDDRSSTEDLSKAILTLPHSSEVFVETSQYKQAVVPEAAAVMVQMLVAHGLRSKHRSCVPSHIVWSSMTSRCIALPVFSRTTGITSGTHHSVLHLMLIQNEC